ncbi:MAG TPA: prenyltransferase/squalene oxidase repeat-containing protein [Fimbriiglobus sp.]|nr:prenyltransferase/squalene oxidase repeat-containing protein [Fimbriiglobus sp.]
MRLCFALLVCVVPAVAAAQDKAATVKYVLTLRDPTTGAYRVTPDGKPSLRACTGAVKALHYLGAKVPEPEKTAKFVLSCYDPQTGAFAEPGGKPDVAITSVGVMAAVDLGIPKEKYAKAMDYLKATAKTFEEVRIGAAALEALNEKPEWVTEWFKIADDAFLTSPFKSDKQGRARMLGGFIAMKLRLGVPAAARRQESKLILDIISNGQRDDGGFGDAKAEASDLGSTYRVMRALHLLKEKPRDAAALRKFVASCRNKDGGYGVTPDATSSMSGVYYAAIVSKWLDEMEK